jgi:LmbE family N-acetylglucosaminyl deacetylase
MTVKRILVIAPHPDDETLSLGATIAKLDVNSKIISKMIVGF